MSAEFSNNTYASTAAICQTFLQPMFWAILCTVYHFMVYDVPTWL